MRLRKRLQTAYDRNPGERARNPLDQLWEGFFCAWRIAAASPDSAT